jgi:hypothetical protein
MNWEAIGAIGQVLSAAALGFVMLQIGQAREQMRRSISDARAQALREMLVNRANHPELRATLVKARRALDRNWKGSLGSRRLVEEAGLTQEESDALVAEQAAWWNNRVQMFPYLDDLSPDERGVFDAGLRSFYGDDPVGRLWIGVLRESGASSDLLRYIDGVLAQSA